MSLNFKDMVAMSLFLVVGLCIGLAINAGLAYIMLWCLAEIGVIATITKAHIIFGTVVVTILLAIGS